MAAAWGTREVGDAMIGLLCGAVGVVVDGADAEMFGFIAGVHPR